MNMSVCMVVIPIQTTTSIHQGRNGGARPPSVPNLRLCVVLLLSCQSVSLPTHMNSCMSHEVNALSSSSLPVKVSASGPSSRTSRAETQLPKRAGMAITPLSFDEELVLYHSTTKVLHEEVEQAVDLGLLNISETTLLTSCQGPTSKSFQHEMKMRDIQIITPSKQSKVITTRWAWKTRQVGGPHLQNGRW